MKALKKNRRKKYLIGTLIFFSAFLVFGASFVHGQTAPVIPIQPTPLPPTSPVLNPTPVIPTGPTTPTQGTAPNAYTQQTVSLLSCSLVSGDLITCGIATVADVVKVIFGWLIVLGGALVSLSLTFNGNLFISPIVQTGFSVVLSVANLGFVLGIIVIALATILRNETYGIKKMLGKLIVMAILVNFGLVITGPIVGFADNLTSYFMNAGGNGGASNFSTNLVAAFQPQVLANPAQGGSSSGTGSTNADPSFSFKVLYCMVDPADCIAGGVTGAAASYFSGNKQPADTFVVQVVGLVFQIILILIIAFTLIAIADLMFVRYVYLTFLLILLPVAWLMWVFPKMSHYFSEWWGLFLRWTFFPAISIFFLYLAMLIAPGSTGTSSNPNYIAQLLGAQTGTSIWTTLALTIVSQLILCAIAIGGLVAANTLGIKGADTAIEAGRWASGRVQGYVGKRANKARVAATNRVGTAVSKSLRSGRPSRLPLGLGRLSTVTGRAIEPRLTNAAMVDAAKKKVPDNPETIKQNLLGSMNMEDTLAHLSKLREKGGLSPETMVRDQKVGDFLDANKEVIDRYGWKKDAGEADKAIGSNADMRAAAGEVVQLQTSGQDTTTAEAKLLKARQEFVAKMEKGDIGKLNVNEVLGGENKSAVNRLLATELMKEFALSAPQLIPGALSKMKSKNLKNFDTAFDAPGGIIDQLKAAAENIKNATERDERLKHLDHVPPKGSQDRPGVRQSYRRAYGTNATSAGSSSSTTGGSPAAPGAPAAGGGH
jgi:hypothetical protein